MSRSSTTLVITLVAFLAGCPSSPSRPQSDGWCSHGVDHRHVAPEELEDGANEGDRDPHLGANESDAPFLHPRHRFRLGEDE